MRPCSSLLPGTAPRLRCGLGAMLLTWTLALTASPAGAQQPAPGATPAPPPPGAAPAPQPPGAAPYPYPTQAAPPPAGQPYPAYPPRGAPAPGQPPPPGYYQPLPRKEPPLYLPYQEGQKIPPGYYLEDRGILGLQIAGVVTTGTAYLVGFVLVSAMSYPNETKWMLLPVVGPFITMATREHSCDIKETEYCKDKEGWAVTMLALDGGLQAAGAAMLITGLAVRRQRLVRETVGDVGDVTIGPMPVGSGYGLGAYGTF
jgi:hypothetical protein